MKLRLLILFSILLTNEPTAFSQIKDTDFETQHIGNPAPDYTLNNLLNYPKKSVNLRDFKGKVLILDFWSFGCTSCIESWPKLMKLQDQFKDKIQIILLNPYESKELNIKNYLNKRGEILGYKMTLPTAYGNEALKKLFPHESVPHVVFIDDQGVIKYISIGTYLNEETISKMIAHQEINIPVKSDHFEDISWFKPVFVNGNGTKEAVVGNVLFTTLIKEFSINVSAATEFGRFNGITYGALVNYPIKTMFRTLYAGGMNDYGLIRVVPNSKTVLKTDSSKYVPKTNGTTRLENCYSIQITAKREIPINQLQKKMITELEQYFNLKTGWEKELKKCLVITRNNMPLKVYESGERKLDINSLYVSINKVSLKEFIEIYESSSGVVPDFPYPIVDETNFEGKLGEIAFEADVCNFNVLNKALNKYGLELSIQDRLVDVLVIDDFK